MPVASSTSATVATKSGAISWCAETFTAIPKACGGPSPPCPGAPPVQVGTGPLEHPPPDVVDRPALLGQRDQRGRRNEAERRVVPAQEGLGAEDPPVADADDRLVLGAQLPPLDRQAEVPLEHDHAFGQALLPNVDHLVGAASPALGLVHGDVGLAEQFLGIGPLRGGERDADAGRHLDDHVIERERGPQRLHDPAWRSGGSAASW